LISDKTHTVPVEFNVEATDKFEKYASHRLQADIRERDANLEHERLTKNLRALMYVESYRWKVDSPRGRTVQGLEMPELKMEILEWSIFLGGELPVFFENTVEVGWGKDDGAAQKVLRKWYFGE
jgi:phage gp29-like protein